ncbi:MAG: cysteine desulfurase [Verrucomicrobia subdivision 3 bacterium]|nr:cysteine desulfurase [Limisphaerales bacterium]
MFYFDYNATAPVIREARDAWLETTDRIHGNPSSPHAFGLAANKALTDARERLAHHLGCHPADIIWTSGATEANNMALHHFAQTLDAKSEVWISAIEHPCVHDSSRHYFGKRVKIIPVTHDGGVDMEWFATEMAYTRPGVVSVMCANNETGVIQPWRELLAICQAYEVPFFTDAVQWLGKMPSKGLGECDFVTGAAHKFGGPRGVGFLKAPHKAKINSLLFGGKQERGQRAGTENLPIIVAMLAALDVREKQLANNDHETRAVWRDKFEKLLLRQVPGTTVVGLGAPRLWNTVSALMPEGGQQRWVTRLDKAGFAVSTGSACTTGKEEPSHVLSAMGYKAGQVTQVLRFSSGWETTAADWEALEEGILRVYGEVHHTK